MKETLFLLFGLTLSSLMIGCNGATDKATRPLGGGTASPSSASDASKPIQVVGFDEHDETLQAIIDGEVHGTVVQNPYMYGF